MEKLKLLQLQLGLFFEDIESRPDKFVSRMTEVTDNIFDQMPIILPIPNEAPPEIPVVIMNSQDGLYTCNISKSRIDFIANLSGTNQSDISSQLDRFINNVRPYSAIVFGYKKIVRFGFIAQYFYETEDATEQVRSKYIKPKLNNLEELNIRYNNRCRSNDLELNNIVDLSQGEIMQQHNSDDITKKGILLLRDINNVPTDDLIAIRQ